jgi:hypothetical protein
MEPQFEEKLLGLMRDHGLISGGSVACSERERLNV